MRKIEYFKVEAGMRNSAAEPFVKASELNITLVANMTDNNSSAH